MTGTKVGKEVGAQVGTNEGTFTWQPKGRRESDLRIDTRMIWSEVDGEWQVEVTTGVIPDRGSHAGITISSTELGEAVGDWIEIGQGIAVSVAYVENGRELEIEIGWRLGTEEHRFNVKRHPNAETEPHRVERVELVVDGSFAVGFFGPVTPVRPESL